jgi:hypothetical protein
MLDIPVWGDPAICSARITKVSVRPETGSIAMKAELSGVPDLLRRFVETPYAVSFTSGDATVRIEANEFALLNKMHGAMVSQNGFGTEILTWKLIRDEAAPCDGKELTILFFGPLNVILAGTGTVIAIDREQREVLGFIAANVSSDEFVTALLPIVLKLSHLSVTADTAGQAV